ncbi:hypothetical protein [Streptomyces sp. NPDC002588]|uniref:hypothetical protein n=1 Tax=Streptomyces sp. NPDC002588 TaxID=3154419 RepID=UPI003334449B
MAEPYDQEDEESDKTWSAYRDAGFTIRSADEWLADLDALLTVLLDSRHRSTRCRTMTARLSRYQKAENELYKMDSSVKTKFYDFCHRFRLDPAHPSVDLRWRLPSGGSFSDGRSQGQRLRSCQESLVLMRWGAKLA